MAFSGEKLRLIRVQRGLSQRDLPVGHDTVSALESGHRKPHPSTLRKLAEALDVEVSDFFDDPAVSPRAALPEGFDVVGLTQEVATEHPEVPTDSAEFRKLVDERFASELGHLPKAELKAIEANLRARYNALDRNFHSPLWSDPEQYGDWLQLWDEIRAVKLALVALDRVLTKA